MSRTLRWLGMGLAGLVVVVLLLTASAYAVGSSKLGRSYEVRTASLAIPTDSAALARGAHLARIHGCVDCHGADLSGRVFVDAPPFRVVASNLTSGRGGVGSWYSAADFDRAIRHGLRPDGTPLFIMPSAAFHGLSDADAADLIAYVQSVAPVDNELPPTEFRTLGRILTAFALDPAHEVRTVAARVSAPAPGPSAEYGAYLASITCAYCHGQDLRGAQPAAPGSPPAPDLAGAGRWSFDEFARTLRTGITPDGRRLDPEFMPWSMTANMTDEELRALWIYVRQVAAEPIGDN